MSTPTILVCRGAEYQAVCKGLSHSAGAKPIVLPIPVGPHAVKQHLTNSRLATSEVLVMGLCGSLSASHRVGDIVLYRECLNAATLQRYECDRPFTDRLAAQLNVPQVTALTSDRMIHKAAEKRQLAETGAEVVDMEGFAVLDVLHSLGIAVAMLRVVSDDCHRDVPDLSTAVSPEGVIRPIPLALGMLRQPIAAARLIRGSLQGLNQLQTVTRHLF